MKRTYQPNNRMKTNIISKRRKKGRKVLSH